MTVPAVLRQLYSHYVKGILTVEPLHNGPLGTAESGCCREEAIRVYKYDTLKPLFWGDVVAAFGLKQRRKPITHSMD